MFRDIFDLSRMDLPKQIAKQQQNQPAHGSDQEPHLTGQAHVLTGTDPARKGAGQESHLTDTDPARKGADQEPYLTGTDPARKGAGQESHLTDTDPACKDADQEFRQQPIRIKAESRPESRPTSAAQMPTAKRTC